MRELMLAYAGVTLRQSRVFNVLGKRTFSRSFRCDFEGFFREETDQMGPLTVYCAMLLVLWLKKPASGQPYQGRYVFPQSIQLYHDKKNIVQ